MRTATINLSLPKSLLARIDDLARAESRSRSELLREAGRMYLDRRARWDEIFRYAGETARRRRLSPADVGRAVAEARRKRRGR